ILGSGVVSPVECLHYAMSLPASVVITGMEQIDRVDQALQAVQTFAPLSAQQMAALRARTKTAAAGGRYELFKTSARFDGTARHPEWLGWRARRPPAGHPGGPPCPQALRRPVQTGRR